MDEVFHRYRLLEVHEITEPEKFLQIRYRVYPGGDLDLRGAAIRMLLILSQRTITPLGFETAERRDIEKVGAIVLPEGPQAHGPVTIALPLHTVSRSEGLTQVVLTATSASEYNYTRELWVDDITFPPSMARWFTGPRLGVEGIREILGIQGRPLLGYIVKSRAAESAESVLGACRDALAGGVDLLVDDILTTDPSGSLGFEERVPAIAALVRAHNSSLEPGQSRAGVIANVGGDVWRAEELIKLAKMHGALGAMVDCFTMGFGNVKELIDRCNRTDPTPFAFITTNMGSGIMGRNPDDEREGAALKDRRFLRTGFSEALTAKLARLAGADAVHTGTVGSECFEVAEYSRTHRTLSSQFPLIKPSFAVGEGDIQLAHVAENVLEMGENVIIETASGIANHPTGVRTGARAFRLFLGCLNQELDRDDVNEVLNLLQGDPDNARILEPVLAEWRARMDGRIRSGWPASESQAILLRHKRLTPELQELLRQFGKPAVSHRRGHSR